MMMQQQQKTAHNIQIRNRNEKEQTGPPSRPASGCAGLHYPGHGPQNLAWARGSQTGPGIQRSRRGFLPTPAPLTRLLTVGRLHPVRILHPSWFPAFFLACSLPALGRGGGCALPWVQEFRSPEESSPAPRPRSYRSGAAGLSEWAMGHGRWATALNPAVSASCGEPWAPL